MKKFLFFFFISAALFSCDKVTKIEPDPNAIPDAVVNAVKVSFQDASNLTVVILKHNELYSVDFNTAKSTYEAVITEKGEMKELRQNAKTLDVSQNIQSYLDANFPNSTLNQVVEDLDPQDKLTVVGYWVYISTSDGKYYQLYFNQLGGFVSQMELTSNPNSTTDKYSITQNDLPVAITNYLNANNSGYVFAEGWAVVIDNVTTYYISINYNNQIYYYNFDANANVLSSSTYDPSTGTGGAGSGGNTADAITDATQIPSVISTYLNQNFAGWQFLKGVVESNNGTPTHYIIVIMVGTDNYYVEFDGNMQFIGATIY